MRISSRAEFRDCRSTCSLIGCATDGRSPPAASRSCRARASCWWRSFRSTPARVSPSSPRQRHLTRDRMGFLSYRTGSVTSPQSSVCTGLSWIEQPPPLEIRMGEPPNFMGGPSTQGTRTHWMRLPRDVGDDPLLHAALLAYASDYLLLDMVLRAYPDRAALEVVHLCQPGPLAVVPPPGPPGRLASPHAGDAGHLRPSGLGARPDP